MSPEEVEKVREESRPPLHTSEADTTGRYASGGDVKGVWQWPLSESGYETVVQP